MLTDVVRVPYTTAPFMVQNLGRPFTKNFDSGIIKKKQKELDLHGIDLYGQIDEAQPIIKNAAARCNLNADNVLDFGLLFAEDIAIMHKGLLAAICFCFPSGFVPRERVGLSLEKVHDPVADGDKLRKASAGITKAMTEKESFVRHVWTVTNNPDLSNHPKNRKIITPMSIDDLYFRTERQTTLRVNSDTSLFFVKVDVVPLKTVYTSRILDSINSMSPAILEYKNLTLIKKLLNSKYAK